MHVLYVTVRRLWCVLNVGGNDKDFECTWLCWSYSVLLSKMEIKFILVILQEYDLIHHNHFLPMRPEV